MEDKRPAEPRVAAWARIDDYLVAMARRRAAIRKRAGTHRFHREQPPTILAALPFLALLGGIGIITVGVMIAAWPGGRVRTDTAASPPADPATARPGWLERAPMDER